LTGGTSSSPDMIAVNFPANTELELVAEVPFDYLTYSDAFIFTFSQRSTGEG
jgi:hypothetical protein